MSFQEMSCQEMNCQETSRQDMSRQDMSLGARFLLLQVNDALFPIGAYSHSYGLETYIQKGLVSQGSSARLYIENRLRYSLLYSDLLAVRLSYQAARQGDLPELERLENILDASKIPLELREASRKLGSRFVKTLQQLDIPWKSQIFQDYQQLRRGTFVSHPCAYGVFCCAAGIPLQEALAAFLYAQASSMVTNCVKTIPLSQSQGQQILLSLHPVLEEVLSLAAEAGEEMFCASTPGFDLRSIQHESLYSRLYMS